ncbi:peroxiredoxin-like family protein [Shewanella submarina]|uniref:thioredoxin-dependent peroxiredoxin n=1 Tax=Shewanella submarina TaxID=2016376 RepID=A0ABV7GC97_9GAMM
MRNKLITSLLTSLLLSLSLPMLAKAEIAPDAVSVAPLLNGETLPDVTLRDIDGNKVDLKALVSQKPSILFFYRGGWCPYCNAQMGQLKAIEPRLLEMGFQLIGISPDSPEKLKASIRDNKLDYTLLSDANLDAAQAFGLAFFTDEKTSARYLSRMPLESLVRNNQDGHKRLVLPVPAVYMLDKQGLVHFQYVNPNFKVRPAPELILTAAGLLPKN